MRSKPCVVLCMAGAVNSYSMIIVHVQKWRGRREEKWEGNASIGSIVIYATTSTHILGTSGDIRRLP